MRLISGISGTMIISVGSLMTFRLPAGVAFDLPAKSQPPRNEVFNERIRSHTSAVTWGGCG